MSKGCIIYCIEGGRLEKNTILSIASIRRFGGELNSFDIYCVQPRDQFPISQKTRSALKELDVVLIQKPLNVRHKYYALANKPIVCDYMIKNHRYDRYIFLDGDTLVLNESAELWTSNSDISISPVAHKGVGVASLRDANGAYWSKILKLAKADPDQLRFVQTSLDKERVLAYWNTGVISFDGRSNICNEWSGLVHRALDQKLYPDPGIFFVEQTCLSAVLMNSKYNIDQISLQVNFPLTKNCLHHFDEINLDEIAILHHYQNLDLIINRKIRIIGQDKEIWIRDQVARLQLDPKDVTGRIASLAQALQMKLVEKFYFFVYRINAK